MHCVQLELFSRREALELEKARYRQKRSRLTRPGPVPVKSGERSVRLVGEADPTGDGNNGKT